MTTDYVSRDIFVSLLDGLMPENRDAMLISLMTGLRISDVLALEKHQVDTMEGRTTWVTEQKTGKQRPLLMTKELRRIFLRRLVPGSGYFFPHRLDSERHRTRQAVWKDLKRMARMYRIDGKKLRENIGPHSARKTYAVELLRQVGDIDQVQVALNHTDPAVTCLYAMADILTQQRLKEEARERRVRAEQTHDAEEARRAVSSVAPRGPGGYATTYGQAPPSAQRFTDLTKFGK